MPTPSSNTANESHSFPSTCPDEQTPHSPSSWHPPPPYPPRPIAMIARGDESRSTTMSPPPPPNFDDVGREPESILPDEVDTEDSHKLAETDEDITLGENDADRRRRAAARYGTAIYAGLGPEYARSRRRRAGQSASDVVSPVSAEGDKLDDSGPLSAIGWSDDSATSMGYDFSNLRVIPTSPSSYLRPGSRFTGTQQSERQVYDVEVEIKHVDLRECFLCGYLRIQGLTEDHPSLTTYFEGEIIGTKYGFMTKHESWGATDRIDLNHWAKFGAFRPFAKQAKKGNVVIKDFAQKENIFMRWKEHFLVPNHRQKSINGASFEGFYYICFNQIEGRVSGIYFHSKSEKFQQLELKHVQDKGCYGAMEFR